MDKLEDMSQSISRLVLASSSPRRKELVASLNHSLPVIIFSTDVDELVDTSWKPAEIVEQLSLRKARAAIERMEEDSVSLVLGADTIVVLDGEVLGKPKDEADAKSMLLRLQGRTHEVYSGVALIRSSDGYELSAHRVTKVQMKSLSEDQINRYVATGEPNDKAGAYGIQGLGATIVERIEGCYFNVVGLPLSLLADMLAQFEIQIF